MRTVFLILLLIFPAKALAADKHEAFYGTWGTVKQCAREPIKQGGTFLAEPFEISKRWLKKGQLYCSLNWAAIDTRKNGFFTGAHAICGEDSLRGYFVGMELSGEDLTLRWDFPLSNGPLARCPRP